MFLHCPAFNLLRLTPRGPLLSALLFAVTACSPAGYPASAGPVTSLSPASSVVRTLRIGQTTDPLTLYGNNIFHGGLTYYDENDALLPGLAVKVPSSADGDWKALQDGRMEVTWKLKPGLTWHDGAPLTADDFVFALKLFKDKASTFPAPRGISFASGVTAPDSETIVVQYARLFNSASVAGPAEFPSLPSHILEPRLPEIGAEGVTSGSFWSTGWVGLGPYRMTDRVMGSHIEAEAFPGYFKGQPKIGKIHR